MTAPAEILALCRARGLTLASAESCTGGMVGAALTDVAGSSDVYERGVITYSNAAKTALLGVRPETLDAFGAVSEEVAREMAEGLLARAPVDIAVSVTGIAGPGGSEHKPEGRVCFGLATKAGCRAETVDFGALGRDAVRIAARDRALELIADAARYA
jgi:nicotinamide-nucleotide amidase